MKFARSLSVFALVATAGLGLTACGGTPTATATSPNVEPIAANAASATPAASAAEKSARGNLIKKVGQPAGMSGKDGKNGNTGKGLEPA